MKTQQESIFSSKTLSYFLHLAETMSYTQAAQILGITQPALTQQIKKLERSVGAPLFYSVGKKLHLSDAGYTMLDATHQIYETLNKATDEIQQSTSATQGNINIGILSSVEYSIFSDFAVEYYKQHNDITISTYNLSRKEIWERLENNTIDLAIMYLPDSSIKNWKPYESKRILTEDLIFIHKNEKFAKRKKVKLKDTLTNKWVTYPSEYYLNETIREVFCEGLTDQPTSVAHFADPDQIFNFAIKTGCFTALPMSYVLANNTDNQVFTALFDPEIKFDLSFVFRKGKEQIPRIESFFKSFDRYLNEKDYITRLSETNA